MFFEPTRNKEELLKTVCRKFANFTQQRPHGLILNLVADIKCEHRQGKLAEDLGFDDVSF
jgi:hypothetical protein